MGREATKALPLPGISSSLSGEDAAAAIAIVIVGCGGEYILSRTLG